MTVFRGPVVGIVGAGQLARMTVQAAIPLSVRVRLLAARADDSAALVWPDVMLGAPDSAGALREFAAGCDVLTFDHELVDPAILAMLEADGHRLRPGAAALLLAQDKGEQRTRFAARGLPVPPFRMVRTAADLTDFAAEYGWPVVVKARRGGYDGRGVWVVAGEDAMTGLLETVARDVDLMVEPWLRIERELAVLVARRPDGESVSYPPVETVQVDGICHEVLAPALTPPGLTAAAERLALDVAGMIGAVGILAVEMFVVDGALLINELALRPHNSGHLTIEGATTSQFENHLRAVLDWPLGSTALTAPAVAMRNVLGGPAGTDPAARLPEALAIENAHVHLYGKAARPGRKLGHVTVLAESRDEARARARRAGLLLSGGPESGNGDGGRS